MRKFLVILMILFAVYLNSLIQDTNSKISNIENKLNKINISNGSNESNRLNDPNHIHDTAHESPMKGNFIERSLSKLAINILKTDEGRVFFENIIAPETKFLPHNENGFKLDNSQLIKSMFNIKDFYPHQFSHDKRNNKQYQDDLQKKAICGHVVTIDYQIFDKDANLLTQDSSNFSLGTNKIAPGLDAIIVGMSKNQTRHAHVQSKFLHNNNILELSNIDRKNLYDYKINVTLVDIMPNNFINKQDVKIFDDFISYKKPILCGDKVSFDMKITNLQNNQIIYDSVSKKHDKIIQMRVGDINYPVILLHGLHGKIPVGTRTILAKGKYMKSFLNEYSSLFPNKKFNQNDRLLIELTNFTIKN